MIPLKQEIEQALNAARGAKPAPRCREKQTAPPAAQLLSAAGYTLSRNGRRATCPKCATSRTDFTVALNLSKEVYFCHRCNSGGKIANLGPAFTFGTTSPARTRKADIPKRQFADWLDAKMSELGDCERKLAQKAADAAAALKLGAGWPLNHLAWGLLGDYYHAQHQFESFWQQATDRCGRLGLYKQWRRGFGV
jgi:hypothetical protein